MTDLFKQLVILEKEAESFGFKWETAAQIKSECNEIQTHLVEIDRPDIQSQ